MRSFIRCLVGKSDAVSYRLGFRSKGLACGVEESRKDRTARFGAKRTCAETAVRASHRAEVDIPIGFHGPFEPRTTEPIRIVSKIIPTQRNPPQGRSESPAGRPAGGDKRFTAGYEGTFSKTLLFEK